MGGGERPQGPELGGGSDATSDAETEEDEGDHAPLTASPWGTQEIGERGPRGDARAGRSDGGKGTSATADGGETRGRHGAWREQGGGKGGCQGWEGVEPWGVGGNSGGREASGVEEHPRRGHHRVGGGVELSQDDPKTN